MVLGRRDHPGPHPLPPDTLADYSLPMIALTGPWIRFHRCQRDPLHFGRTGDNRFDAPGGEFGVLYVARDAHAAFIETFGQVIDIRAITRIELDNRCLSWIDATRPLRVVDLTGPGLARLGADERLASGRYAEAQVWSLARWQHPARPDGIFYRSRHDPSHFSLGLFDRVAANLRVVARQRLSDPAGATLLADIRDTHGFTVIESESK